MTLPLLVFCILGMIQLFMMLQARILTEYAAFRAVRVGSTHSGDCDAMTDAALLALLPSYGTFLNPNFTGSPAQKMAQSFKRHQGDRYVVGVDWPTTGPFAVSTTGPIVWILRELPLPSYVSGLDKEDGDFDQPTDIMSLQVARSLQIQMVYWFPLRIPFANWVMTRMFLAQYGLLGYMAQNPLIETQKANWTPDHALPSFFVVGALTRYANNEFVFPILASATLRMMTPVKTKYWMIGGGPLKQNCPPAPDFPP